MHVQDKFRCPAWGKTCSLCKKTNHFAVMCNSKRPQKRPVGNRRMVSGVDHDTDLSEEYISMLTIKENINEVTSNDNKSKPAASLMINGTLETFLLDSRASVNVVSKKVLEQLFTKLVKKIQNTNTTLVMYNGSEVKPIGKTRFQL